MAQNDLVCFPLKNLETVFCYSNTIPQEELKAPFLLPIGDTDLSSYNLDSDADVGSRTLVDNGSWNFSLFVEQEKRVSMVPYESFQREGASFTFDVGDSTKLSIDTGMQHYLQNQDSFGSVPFLGFTLEL